MRRWLPVVVALAACDTGPDEAFDVPFVLSPEAGEVTIQEARYTAPPQLATYTIQNTGFVPIFVLPALALAEAEGDDSLDLDLAAALVVTDTAPYTAIAPGQTKPLQVTVDDRAWAWSTGSWVVTLPISLYYLWDGQASDDADPLSDQVPELTPHSVDLKITYSLDCDLDDDGVDAVECGGGDCDDQDEDVFPEAIERCNGTDDDCDGAKDEGATDRSGWYLDHDADTYGDPESLVLSCGRPAANYIGREGDCDDDDRKVNPGVVEGTSPAQCSNGLDDDCDGDIDGADDDC